jgi:hypothetical protein
MSTFAIAKSTGMLVYCIYHIHPKFAVRYGGTRGESLEPPLQSVVPVLLKTAMANTKHVDIT